MDIGVGKQAGPRVLNARAGGSGPGAMGRRGVDVAGNMSASLGAIGTVIKPVPNPYGKAGGPAHQKKVAEVAADMDARGLAPEFEYRVPTPGGHKYARFVDVVGKDIQGEVVEMHQVGRKTKGGRPVSREVKALDDIENVKGIRPKFHPYNE
jgi:hypothetical protein